MPGPAPYLLFRESATTPHDRESPRRARTRTQTPPTTWLTYWFPAVGKSVSALARRHWAHRRRTGHPQTGPRRTDHPRMWRLDPRHSHRPSSTPLHFDQAHTDFASSHSSPKLDVIQRTGSAHRKGAIPRACRRLPLGGCPSDDTTKYRCANRIPVEGFSTAATIAPALSRISRLRTSSCSSWPPASS